MARRRQGSMGGSARTPMVGPICMPISMTEYQNIQAALKEVAEYIRYYNFERKHSALDYSSPAQFEQLIHSRK